MFTDAEVNELIIAKFGDQQLNFEEKAELLNSHILSLINSGTKKTSSTSNSTSQRTTAGVVAVSCVAGTWINGVWTFNTAQGFTDQNVSAVKYEQPTQATAVGSSASIWIDYNNNGYFGDGNDYYNNSYKSPTTPSCGNDQVKATARSRRMYTTGHIDLYTVVGCDN